MKNNMIDVVLKVENLTKLYRIGTIGTGSLRQDFTRWWNTAFLKKHDPFFHEQPSGKILDTAADNILWALKGISFEVKKGEVLGIIGHNGSGKSTLLKILSRIVRPTAGTVRGIGKISSLLEVGTGFNPELTGRENIYMSGYILGMSKGEIKKKFKEIVSFSGVEQFIDTPVKRYSSGMYMRLAFAVAAHLEPDILILDEVLAVGDTEFQKKCLVKIEEASQKKGRSIIFVSHDLSAIKRLCNKVLWLEKGQIRDLGPTDEVVSSYLASITPLAEPSYNLEQSRMDLINPFFKIDKIKVKALGKDENEFITVNTPVEINLGFECYLTEGLIEVNMRLFTADNQCVFDLGSPFINAKRGTLAFQSIIPANLLNDINYTVSILILSKLGDCLGTFDKCIEFKVEDLREGIDYIGDWSGIIRPKLDMSIFINEAIRETT
jgi:lipopolysaccharide transport system ATP-binding protein